MSRRQRSRRARTDGMSTIAQWILAVSLIAAVFGGITLMDWDDANAFDRGVGTATGVVRDCWGGKWSGCEVEFSTPEGATVTGELDNSYEVGESVDLEYAVVEPSLIREAGYDTREDVTAGAVITGIALVPAVVLLAVAVSRRRPPDTLGRRVTTGRRR